MVMDEIRAEVSEMLGDTRCVQQLGFRAAKPLPLGLVEGGE
jgi:hypothetical protein